MSAQDITLRSELHDDWQLLIPVGKTIFIFLLIWFSVWGLCLVIRNVLFIIRMIRSNKL